MLQGKKLKVLSLNILKFFCKAMFGFEQEQISSSASIVAMYSIISNLLKMPQNSMTG